MNEKWRFIILILVTLIGLSSIVIILYIAVVVEINLSIGVVIVAIFWAVWFKKTGWYLLSEHIRAQIIKKLLFRR